MKYCSEYESDRVYNLKTLSLDGTKIVHEVNIKYLFGFKESSQFKIEQFYFDKNSIENNQKNGISLPKEHVKDINDTKCRYILCEKETITYDIDGKEFSRKTCFSQHDKLLDYQQSATPECTRSFSVIDETDDLGNERYVLMPGGIHYNVTPGTLESKHLTAFGYIEQVEVQMLDILNIA